MPRKKQFGVRFILSGSGSYQILPGRSTLDITHVELALSNQARVSGMSLNGEDK